MRQISVLVITPQYSPDLGPSAPIYTSLCEDLHQMGYNVTVITAFPNYAGSNTSYHNSRRFFIKERLNGVRILRTYIYTVPKSALWRRLLYHGSFNIFSGLAALWARNADIVVADAPTLWSGVPLLVKAIFQRVPYVYVVHDIYPDVLLQLGVLTNARLINLIDRVERFFYDKAVEISVLSKGFKENLIQKGIPEDKITIIPACVDVDFVRPLPHDNELRDRWGLREKFVILYAGNIGFSQGLETILEVAQLLINYSDIAFVLVGEGATKKTLQATAEKNELSNVRFFPFQPREDVPLIYSLADLSLVPLKRDIVIESVPSKTYTIMASGRPIVATADRNTEVGHLIDKAKCGFCVEPQNQDALAQAIMRLYRNDSLRKDMGRLGRDFVVENYSRDFAANRYKMLIEHHVDKDGKHRGQNFYCE